jgi:hypothetical protein
VPSTRQSGILQGDRSGLVQSHNQVQEMSAGIIARLCPRFMCLYKSRPLILTPAPT